MLDVIIIFFVRCLLVGLFLPFSAFDKVVNFKQALAQGSQVIHDRRAATALIVAGFCIEVFMSVAILTGFSDRLAALILAGYCIVTALLWKQFWTHPDFRFRGASPSREVFWDFMKNISLAGGFLLLAFGTDAAGVQRFLDHPLESSHPYFAAKEPG